MVGMADSGEKTPAIITDMPWRLGADTGVETVKAINSPVLPPYSPLDRAEKLDSLSSVTKRRNCHLRKQALVRFRLVIARFRID
jgi:hypothetical protein